MPGSALSRWDPDTTPNRGHLASTHTPVLREGGRQAAPPVSAPCEEENEKVLREGKDCQPTQAPPIPLHLAAKPGNRPHLNTICVRGTFERGSFLAAGMISRWFLRSIHLWQREERSFAVVKMDLNTSLPELCPSFREAGVKPELGRR